MVVEILSPEDRMSRVFEKCRQYARIGILKTFVLDPQLQYAWEWSRETENLERVSNLLLPNGRATNVAEIWQDLERCQQPVV